jgi:hypothetical protein
VTNNAFNQCQWTNTGLASPYTAGFQEIDIGITWDYSMALYAPDVAPTTTPPPPPALWSLGEGDDNDDDS